MVKQFRKPVFGRPLQSYGFGETDYMMMRGEVLASVALVICSTQIYMGQTEDQSKLCLHLRLFLRFTCLAKEKKSLGWNAGKPG